METKRLENWAIQISNNSWFPLLALALITVLAAGLRFFRLGEWSFWIDEIYTINHAQLHFGNLELILNHIPPARNWVPISVILTAQVLNLLSVNEWSARLVSAVIGILTIPILYFPLKKIFGDQVTLIALLLLAVSPWHIFWSQNARFYTSLTLLYVLAGFALFFAFEFNRPKYIFLFFIIFYFALSERLIAGFIFPVVFLYFAAIWLFPFEKPSGLNKKNGFFLLFPFLLIVLYEASRFLSTGESLTTDFIVTFAGQQFENPPRLLAAISFNMGLPVIALGLIGGLFLVLQKNRLGLFLLISTLLPIALVIFLNPLSFTKDRYVFMTLPVWLCMVAVAVNVLVAQTKGYGKLVALGVLGVLLFDAFGSNLLYYHVNNGNRNNWKAAFQLVKERSLDGDNYVAWWPEFGPFYLEREILPWKDITPGFVTESGDRFWFVVDSETVWGNIPMMNWLQKNGELIDILYLRLPEDDFNLNIYLYDPAISSAHRN